MCNEQQVVMREIPWSGWAQHGSIAVLSTAQFEAVKVIKNLVARPSKRDVFSDSFSLSSSSPPQPNLSTQHSAGPNFSTQRTQHHYQTPIESTNQQTASSTK